MIILGVILLVIGFRAKITFAWTIGFFLSFRIGRPDPAA